MASQFILTESEKQINIINNNQKYDSVIFSSPNMIMKKKENNNNNRVILKIAYALHSQNVSQTQAQFQILF